MTQDHTKPHVLPLSVYLTVGSALLVLTVVTVWVAQFDIGSFNLVVAMTIAAVKGTLVALYFMHLRYDHKFYSIIFIGALFFLAVFIIITMFDTMRRDDIYKFRGTPVNDAAVIYDKADEILQSDSLAIEPDATGSDSSQAETATEH